MTPFSILDLAPVVQGGDVAGALCNALDLARRAERWGYRRFWLAEHHGLPGVASAATAVVVGHVAAGTTTIRVGAGGIMLPNHAPLVIAEQFGTLEALFPGRIDLGLGRAPGSDQTTARALRRTLGASPDDFPRDAVELMRFMEPSEPGQTVRAIPGEGARVPVWILGSSLYGASLAAILGLPFAFASHFAPAELLPALEIYRERFRPSPHLERPYAMVACNVFAADDEDEARFLATSMQQAFVNLRTGRPGRLPPPVRDYESTLGVMERTILGQVLSYTAVGGRDAGREKLRDFVARTAADELMITSNVYDHAARLRSHEIAADACRSLGIAADACRSLEIAADACRSLEIAADACRSLEIAADACRSLG
ncbi:MAG: LLM class flavin-dependent oxidoreductase [Deltaproteobacteria bacterium]|nr:LLM class flavin-dependent oxidoreductase [Deltaproteobacteria bacterium]